MTKSLKDILIIALATVILTFLVWLPHLLKVPSFYNLDFSAGFNTIYRNYDGMEYIIIAKSLYNPEIIASMPQSLPDLYYAAHFPGYALLILLVAPILGFLKSMLFISILFTALSAIAFYFLLKDFKLTSQPLFLSLVFLVLPARWLVVHSVGSSEPIFIFFSIMTLYFFMKFEQQQRFYLILLSGVFGFLMQLSRPPAILLFIALALYLFWKTVRQKNWFKEIILMKLRYSPLGLIPLAIVAVFFWYAQSYGDFFAYFNTGDNRHFVLPPFQVFNKEDFWVGDIWLEDIIYIFLIYLVGGLLLIKQKLYPLAFYVLVYLSATMLVTHRDISRYILPVTPFILIAFEKIIVTKEFKIALGILLLAIYLYAQNFLLANTAPIPNVELFN